MKKVNCLLFLLIFLISFVSASPNISGISINPEKPKVMDNVEICANVTDNSSEIVIVRITLQADSPPWNWGLIMDEQNDETYCKSLSPYLMNSYEGKNISYYISARNALNEVVVSETFYYNYSDFVVPDPEDPEPEPNPEPLPRSKVSHSNVNDFGDSPCLPNWKCLSWSECSNGFKVRNCYDTNYCDVSYGEPVEMISCGGEENDFLELTGGVLGNQYISNNSTILVILLSSIFFLGILIFILRNR